MNESSPRWHEVTRSEQAHERRALADIREILPDETPWAAWSNFTFTSDQRRHREVDLLVATPNGLHLIEIKNFNGHLTNDGKWWSHRGRSYRTPVDLAVQKSKELRSHLEVEARRVDSRMKVPFITASVFLAEPTMTSALDHHQRQYVYAPDDAVNSLPRLGKDLLFARGDHPSPELAFLRALPQLLHRIGISASAPSRTVGPWRLEPLPYEEGPTWQDFHAGRPDVPGAHRRIRIYLQGRLDDAAARASVQHAAEREFRAAQGLRHPGILVPSDLEEHELGPALVIDQDPQAKRLDHWLVVQDDLSMITRLGLIRQLARAVAFAHRRRLVHRALSPRAVIVEAGPTVRVGEWQVAARGLSASRTPQRVAPTAMADGHLDPSVDAYLAPEFAAEADGTVDLDVFGVGALAYLTLTGSAPADSRASLLDRLAAEGGLDPSTGEADLDRVVREATAPRIADRTPSVDDIADALVEIERRLGAQAGPDPLDAHRGTVLPGGYAVEEVLGSGSAARAFLVRRDGLRSVVKVAKSIDADRLLSAEAAAMEDLRHEHLVVLRRGPFSVRPRRAIELSYAGSQTLAQLLAEEGPLTGEVLRSLGDQLLDAVVYLHDRGTFHRDVKPTNIGVRSDDRRGRLVQLFDFSLAGATSTDVGSGTPGYRDPHLGTTARPTYDASADLYGLAATLHEMASLDLPRWGDDGTDPRFVDAVTLRTDRFDPDLREPLESFFRTATEKDASRRFASPAAMRDGWNAIFAAPEPAPPAETIVRLDVHVDVLAHLRGLAPRRQLEVVDAISRAATPSPRLDAPPGARDDRMRTLAVEDDLTGVVLLPDSGDRALLVKLFDDAAARVWARHHTASVNGVSGTVEFRDAVSLDALASLIDREATTGAAPLFAHIAAEDLRRLGLDVRVVSFARSLTDAAVLESAQQILPEEQFAVLHALAAGRAVDDVYTELVGPRVPDDGVDGDDLGAAVERTQGKILVLENFDGLTEYLQRPISQWRTFLHPSQQRVAYRPSYWGSAQVTGGPGTGKTVAALHRVKHLAESKDLGPSRILLTTYTKALASALERDLRQMLDVDRAETALVLNIDAWAHRIVRDEKALTRIQIIRDSDSEDRWREAARTAGTSETPSFLKAEWENVVKAQQLDTEQDYLDCLRHGRGRRLPRDQRRPVWEAMAAYERGLRSDRLWTHVMVADEAARLLRARDKPPFDHVVVDEVQDLHPAQWRLLRAAVPRKPDDLFLTGDPHQRIYGNRVSLKQVGIQVAGRSSKLTVNYRTSAEILAWALRMLGHGDDEGMDGVVDDLATYRSSFSGEPPEVVGSPSLAEEMASMADAVKEWHDDGLDWEDIAVVGRGKHIWSKAKTALSRAGVPVVELGGSMGEAAVRVGTMHGLKGLEFRAVAVVGVSQGTVPRAGITSESDDRVLHEQEMQAERNLLFVAATRPRERLRVSWSNQPSRLLASASMTAANPDSLPEKT